MPRPPEFDRNQVLDRAMNTFWRQGYSATSMKDLTNATGLQPGSLYCAFNSKRALFMESLETYFERSFNNVRQQLSGGDTPVQRIRRLFEWLLTKSLEDPDNKGCMMVNTLVETPMNDDAINNRVTEMFRDLESELVSTIREAQGLNQISTDKDPETLSRILLMAMHGIRIYCKTKPNSDDIRGAVDDLLDPHINHLTSLCK